MDINRGYMNALFTGYNTLFKDAFSTAPNTFEQFSMSIPASGQIVEYPFLEAFGGMREWIGDRQIKNISSKKLTIKERPFEDTVSVKKRDIETDTFSVYSPLIQQMGLNAGKLWNDLAYEALCGNGDWLDGNPFFGTTRKYGKNTINNYTTSALSVTAFNTAYLTMMSYKTHNDRPMGVVPNLLLVGPKLRTIAWNIVKNQFSYDSSDKVQIGNVNENLVDLLIVPDLIGDYDNYWFLLSTKGVIKPVIVQKGKEPIFTRLDKDTDENVFMRNEFLYGTEAYGAAALAFPHLAYAGIVS